MSRDSNFGPLLMGLTVGLLGACSHTPANRPEDIKVEVRREKPNDKCQELGVVTGKSVSTKASSEEVLEDLRKDAAIKGANYVWLENFSSMGAAARGMAYLCP